MYRLIDLRNGNTFYVGRGTGNRLFSYVIEAQIDKDQDVASAKISTIREIQGRGYEVIHVIQRWGLTKKEAKEVEATLIDTYTRLDNLKRGDYSDRGITTVKEIIQRFSTEQFVINLDDEKFIIIKIRQENVDVNWLYETTRYAWKVSYNRVKKYKIVLSVINGIVKAVYRIDDWYQTADGERWYFKGVLA